MIHIMRSQSYPYQENSFGVLQDRSKPLGSPKFKSETSKPKGKTSHFHGSPNVSRPMDGDSRQKLFLDSIFVDLDLNEDKRNLEWNPIRDIKVIRIFKDDILQEVFRDTSDVYE